MFTIVLYNIIDLNLRCLRVRQSELVSPIVSRVLEISFRVPVRILLSSSVPRHPPTTILCICLFLRSVLLRTSFDEVSVMGLCGRRIKDFDVVEVVSSNCGESGLI